MGRESSVRGRGRGNNFRFIEIGKLFIIIVDLIFADGCTEPDAGDVLSVSGKDLREEEFDGNVVLTFEIDVSPEEGKGEVGPFARTTRETIHSGRLGGLIISVKDSSHLLHFRLGIASSVEQNA